RRKGQVAAPYINHPITVAEQLAAIGLGGDVDLLMAAVLHDVVEDTDCSSEDLERAFGPAVTRIVLEVSDDKSLEKERRKALVVETIAHKSRAARLIKLSDLIANVRDVLHHPPHWSLERKLRYLDWAQQVGDAAAGTHVVLEGQLQALITEARQTLNSQAAT
ncbi:MAG TPA: HD domain-containing protein, partial [bacterium]|nr:HD domain-containing protein [bacterium]